MEKTVGEKGEREGGEGEGGRFERKWERKRLRKGEA